MAAKISVSKIGAAVAKEMNREANEHASDTATAQNAAVRKARTKVGGVRGSLRKAGIKAGVVKRRVRVRRGNVRIGKRASLRKLLTGIWFGANEIPIEHIAGNVRARVGAREIRTRTDGVIPRSFVIKVGSGKKLYMQRYAKKRTAYRRILTDISPAMEAARDEAFVEASRLFPEEMEKAVAKRRAREVARRRR